MIVKKIIKCIKKLIIKYLYKNKKVFLNLFDG